MKNLTFIPPSPSPLHPPFRSKNFSINNDVIFCTTHYKQLFKTKGNYDEGFGRAQHKHTKRWGSNPDLSKGEQAEAAKS